MPRVTPEDMTALGQFQIARGPDGQPFRENSGDFIIIAINADGERERIGTVTYKGNAKSGKRWNDPDPIGEARAAFIVRAANSHEDLVKVLGDLLNCVDGAHDPEWLRRTKEAAVAALAKALGQEVR